AEMPGYRLGRMVNHDRVGLVDLPQSSQGGRGRVPAALGGAGEFGPGQQLLAEARVQLEQVGLDGVALGHRGLDRGPGPLPGHRRHGHRYAAISWAARLSGSLAAPPVTVAVMSLPVIGSDEPSRL